MLQPPLIGEEGKTLDRWGRRYYAAINHAARFADGLETDLAVIDLDHHEVIVFVEARFPDRAVEFHSATAGLTACACHEVLDAVLHFGPLVDVIMT